MFSENKKNLGMILEEIFRGQKGELFIQQSLYNGKGSF